MCAIRWSTHVAGQRDFVPHSCQVAASCSLSGLLRRLVASSLCESPSMAALPCGEGVAKRKGMTALNGKSVRTIGALGDTVDASDAIPKHVVDSTSRAAIAVRGREAMSYEASWSRTRSGSTRMASTRRLWTSSVQIGKCQADGRRTAHCGRARGEDLAGTWQNDAGWSVAGPPGVHRRSDPLAEEAAAGTQDDE